MVRIDGFEIATESGAMLRLDCGDVTLAAGVFAEGDAFTCTENDCGADAAIVGIVPIVHI